MGRRPLALVKKVQQREVLVPAVGRGDRGARTGIASFGNRANTTHGPLSPPPSPPTLLASLLDLPPYSSHTPHFPSPPALQPSAAPLPTTGQTPPTPSTCLCGQPKTTTHRSSPPGHTVTHKHQPLARQAPPRLGRTVPPQGAVTHGQTVGGTICLAPPHVLAVQKGVQGTVRRRRGRRDGGPAARACAGTGRNAAEACAIACASAIGFFCWRTQQAVAGIAGQLRQVLRQGRGRSASVIS